MSFESYFEGEFDWIRADKYCKKVADGTHDSPKEVSVGKPLVTSKHLKLGKIRVSDAYLISETDFDAINRRSRVDKFDLIFSMIGTIGEVALATPDLPPFAIKNVGLFKVGEALKAYWLYYYLKSTYGQQAVERRKKGSTQQYVSLTDLRELPVPVPRDSAYMEKAVATLKTLDDLTSSLERQNQALESIAQTLFRSWFVNFDPVHAKAAGSAPDAMSSELASLFPNVFEDSELGPIPNGWSVGRIGDIGVNPRVQGKPGDMPPNTPYVGLEHMPRRALAITEWGRAATVESGKFWFDPSDILFGKLRPYFHKVGLANMKGVCSTDILVVRPKEAYWHAFLTLHVFSTAFIEYATQLSDGARMPRTNWSDMAAYRCAVPPAKLAEEFNNQVRPMFSLMRTNVETMRSLISLRDHLLPRLISGRLRIEDAESAVSALISGLETVPA